MVNRPDSGVAGGVTRGLRTLVAGMRGAVRLARSRLEPDPDGFLARASGVVHVGANSGQERDVYAKYGLRVIWIEPIPEVFESLRRNIEPYPLQSAYRYLVTNADGVETRLNIANNNGQSSSILNLKLHGDVWPEVHFTRTITVRSTTLASLLRTERIDTRRYDALVLDTQGSELLVLQGAEPIMRNLRFLKTEAADFESYEGCCQLGDIERFVAQHGFREQSRRRFAVRPEGGAYYDLVYERPVCHGVLAG
jgi:FkbM family methyltransferase